MRLIAQFAIVALLSLFALVSPREAGASQDPEGSLVRGVRRFSLIIGANNGGASRSTLRYAGTDAKSVAAVLRQLGGVPRSHEILVFEPTPARLTRSFKELAELTFDAMGRGYRVEVIFYYSGHSDEKGLLLHEERVPYDALRSLIKAVPADVRVAILDSCASGAFTRAKGGRKRPPFMVGAAKDVKGYAFLTSSSADENAQESDRLGGSFFTHFLTSGLRGAADSNGDKLVTLNEAYQFAFDETLAQTETARAGAQHAAYEIDLAGSGDLVMTDLRQVDGTLILAADVEGRVFVRDRRGTLHAELSKPSGSSLSLALEPGDYQVTVDHGGVVRRTSVYVPKSKEATVAVGQLAVVEQEQTVERGHASNADYREIPFNFGLFPAASIAGKTRPTVVRANLGVLWSRADRIEGFSGTLGVDLVDERATGVQWSLVGNVARGVVVGGQLSVGFNHAHGNVRGFQGTVFVNEADSVAGAQLAAVVNHADDVRGAQLSLINTTTRFGQVRGAQVGLVNTAGTVGGVQLGLINYARSANVQVGLISATKQGGVHPEVLTSDTAAVSVGLRLAARRTYSLLVAGLHPGGAGAGWQFGVGFGGHIPIRSRGHVDIDIVHYTVVGDLRFRERPTWIEKFRVVFGWQFYDRLTIFGGPTINLHLDGRDEDKSRLGYGYTFVTFDNSGGGPARFRLWPGFVAGLRF